MTLLSDRMPESGSVSSWVRKTASKLKSPPELAVKEKQGLPSNAMYAIDGGKKLAEALQSVSDLIPLPFLSSFVKVGIRVLESCQDAAVIVEDVKDLQDRVYNIMLVVLNSALDGKTSLELRERIETLQLVLVGILTDLTKVKQQRKLLLVFYREMNKDLVDKCVGRLAVALEKFQVASQLHVEASQLRVEDLLARIKADHSALFPQLDRIEATVNDLTQPHNAPSRREDMRLLPPIFHGRDALVEEIALLLATEETSHVCITGVGGIGKTSVAVAVTQYPLIRTVFQQYIFWVPCITAKSSDLLRHILYAQLRITAETYESLDPLIAELDASKQPRLLLLDNFETPWLSGPDPAEVGHILRRLAALPHIALLVTMTSGVTPEGIKWKHVPLHPLEPAAARQVFEETYRDAAGGRELDAGEQDLNGLLDSVGHIPLAITLMASCGGHLVASPDDLLRDWKKAGTEMLSTGMKGTLSMDDTISLSMGRGVDSNPNALRLLAILSMLPAGTTGKHLVVWWAPTLRMSTHAAVRILRTAALIEQSDGPFVTSRIFVRPTIQSYMSQQNRISPEVRAEVHDTCYRFVLHHKSIPDDHKFKADLEALASEETNIQGLLMEILVDGVSRPDAVDALITFGFYQSWTKPSTVVASHALAVACAAHDNPHTPDLDAAARRVAEAYRCLGKTFSMLGRYDKACVYLEEAINRFKTLPGGGDLHCAGEVSLELVRTWVLKGGKSVNEFKSLCKEAQANLSHDETSKYHVARGLLGSGSLIWPGDATLEILSKAKAIFEELDCPASTAESLFCIARAYARRNEYRTALPFATEALTKAKQSGEVDLICRVLSINARYLVVLGSYDDAEAMSTSLLKTCAVLGSPLHNGQALELLAYNCVAKTDLRTARLVYHAAWREFNKIQSTRMGGEGMGRCADNLKMLKSMTGTQNDFSVLKKRFPMI
ncbi:hypothetical protein MSAN_01648900 [Mycena sanguinolenta]|uniref:NB-ARC domain-containing protein n=1 Tax=Mycena sanguinolenta TaxID=230812 RepID=A0A8H6XYV8_9AGAR|nr:hypothetical protein MSAN_01648900 [Mycena sanguinolenta]